MRRDELVNFLEFQKNFIPVIPIIHILLNVDNIVIRSCKMFQNVNLIRRSSVKLSIWSDKVARIMTFGNFATWPLLSRPSDYRNISQTRTRNDHSSNH